MLLEMCNVFGMGKILFSRICARLRSALMIDLIGKGEPLTFVVKLFKMMDLVLILVITMVSWSGLKHVSR